MAKITNYSKFSIILVLFALLAWQWFSKAGFVNQIKELNKEMGELSNDHTDLLLLSGIGPLRSTHQHADVKVYINGQAIDFLQSKYQLAARFIHFEEGVGDVIHMHATGLSMGHLFRSLGMDFNDNCIVFENTDYCRSENKKLRFYVNGKENDEFDNYVMRGLDRILVSYGAQSGAEIQEQLDSVTNLSPKYSKKE